MPPSHRSCPSPERRMEREGGRGDPTHSGESDHPSHTRQGDSTHPPCPSVPGTGIEKRGSGHGSGCLSLSLGGEKRHRSNPPPPPHTNTHDTRHTVGSAHRPSRGARPPSHPLGNTSSTTWHPFGVGVLSSNERMRHERPWELLLDRCVSHERTDRVNRCTKKSSGTMCTREAGLKPNATLRRRCSGPKKTDHAIATVIPKGTIMT